MWTRNVVLLCGYFMIVSITDLYLIRTLGMHDLVRIMDFSAVLSAFVFCVLASRDIRKAEFEMRNSISLFIESRIVWLKSFVGANALLAFLFLTDEVIFTWRTPAFNFGLYLSTVAMLSFYIYIARRPGIFSEAEIEAMTAIRDENVSLPLSVDTANEIKNCIDLLFAKEPIHLDPALNLNSFSKKLGFGPKEVSRFLNTIECKSFSEYISHKRLEHATVELSRPDFDRSILDLAFESGFNSKASFYRQFKKKYGFAPTKYLKTKGLQNRE